MSLWSVELWTKSHSVYTITHAAPYHLMGADSQLFIISIYSEIIYQHIAMLYNKLFVIFNPDNHGRFSFLFLYVKSVPLNFEIPYIIRSYDPFIFYDIKRLPPLAIPELSSKKVLSVFAFEFKNIVPQYMNRNLATN